MALSKGRWRFFFLFLIIVCSADRTDAVPSDWKYFHELNVRDAGFVRVKVPFELIDAAATDFRDLRIFTADGNEIPFLLTLPEQSQPAWEPPRNFDVSVEPRRTVISIQTERGRPVESVILESPANDFLKAANVEGSTDGISWTSLARRRPLFRQDGTQSLNIELDRGHWPYLKIIVDDDRSAPVAFTGCTLRFGADQSPKSEAVPLLIVEKVIADDHMVYTLEAPARSLTWTRFSMEISNPIFVRRATLQTPFFDGQSIREATCWEDVIFRVPVESQNVSSKTNIDLWTRFPQRRLIIRIQNGPNPPLDILSIKGFVVPIYVSFRAERPAPFFLSVGAEGARRPSYDLERLEEFLKTSPAAAVTTGPLKKNPDYREPEPMPFASGAGATLDVSAWNFKKRVSLAGPAIYEFELDLDILSAAGPDGRNLRLINHSGLQIPYVFDYSPLIREAVVEAEEVKDADRPRVSLWKLTLPRERLPIHSIECQVADELFQRDVTLYEVVEKRPGRKPTLRSLARFSARAPRKRQWDGTSFDATREMARSTWTRTPEDGQARLAVAVHRPPANRELFLEIDNGDNAPLSARQFKAYYKTFKVAFKSSGDSEIFAFYGNDRVGHPRYDLALVSDELIQSKKSQALLGPQEQSESPWRWNITLSSPASRVIFWIVLTLVAVGLLVIIARLLPESEKTS